MKINVNAHSSIQIDKIYFDPYLITQETHNAKYIFITHSHYDHLSTDDIDKVINNKSIIIATEDCKNTLEKKYNNKIIYVKPYDNISLSNVEVEVLPAYNLQKQYHKKDSNWVGYKIIYNETIFAILGDTDQTPELQTLTCDHLFVPIGGTYTMTALEASTLANLIKPKIVTPIHYNSIVGNKMDEEVFLKNLDKTIKTEILL